MKVRIIGFGEILSILDGKIILVKKKIQVTQEKETNRDEHVSWRQESATRVLLIGRAVA